MGERIVAAGESIFHHSRRYKKMFRLCGGEAGAFRSPPPPLRPPPHALMGIIFNVGRSRRLCQPP